MRQPGLPAAALGRRALRRHPPVPAARRGAAGVLARREFLVLNEPETSLAPGPPRSAGPPHPRCRNALADHRGHPLPAPRWMRSGLREPRGPWSSCSRPTVRPRSRARDPSMVRPALADAVTEPDDGSNGYEAVADITRRARTRSGAGARRRGDRPAWAHLLRRRAASVPVPASRARGPERGRVRPARSRRRRRWSRVRERFPGAPIEPEHRRGLGVLQPDLQWRARVGPGVPPRPCSRRRS